MKKFLIMLMLMLGLTFIYNPQTNTGFVYYNTAQENYIIIVDNTTNVLRYYKGVIEGEEGLQSGFENWMRDKIQKGMPFKSVIVPYRSPQEQQKQWR